MDVIYKGKIGSQQKNMDKVCCLQSLAFSLTCPEISLRNSKFVSGQIIFFYTFVS